MRQPALIVQPDGWVSGVAHCPSAHCDERPPGCPIDLLVIHNISLPPGQFGSGQAQRLFAGTLDPSAHVFFGSLAGVRVSAHFLIERDGGITQFVSCEARAWHAGRSTHRGRAGCNDCSIGVELEGTDFSPFTPAQYGALAVLVGALRARYALAHVAGHSDVSPERKTDPGPLFDWTRLAADTGLVRG